MKITVKAKGKDSENNNGELQNNEHLNKLQKIETEEELKAKEKQNQIDSLLEYFEKSAADSPELIKDKESYFNSKEFDDHSNENFDFNKKRRAELEDRVVYLEDVYNQEEKKSKNTIPWRNYLVYLMIITSLSCCVTFSKYITEVSGGGSGTVASFNVSAYLVDGSNNKTYTFSESSNSFPLEFRTANELQTYYLLVENKSDVTVDAIFNITNAENHKFEIATTDGTAVINGNTVEIGAGKSKTIELFFFGATKTVTDNATLTITVEQVD